MNEQETISELRCRLKVAELELADRESTLDAYRTQNMAQYQTIRKIGADYDDLATKLDDAIQTQCTHEEDLDTSYSTILKLRENIGLYANSRSKLINRIDRLDKECARSDNIIADQGLQMRAYEVELNSLKHDSKTLSKIIKEIGKWVHGTDNATPRENIMALREIYNIFRDNGYKV